MDCALHPDRTADDLCLQCETPLCSTCVRSLNGGVYCARCYARRWARQKQQRTRLGVGAVTLLLGGGFAFFESRKDDNLARESYGPHTAKITELRATLDGDACNATSASELVQLLRDTDNPTEALEVLDGRRRSCPADWRDLETSARLRLKTRDFVGARRDAQALIGVRPRRGDGYGLSAQARRGSGDHEGAERDYRQAIELDPGAGETADALADMLAGRGELCPAADVLDESLSRRAGADADARRARSAALRRDGRCPAERIEGGEVGVPFENDGDVMVVTVRIEDRLDARMLLDTGASSVAITRSLANRLGLDTSSAPPFYVSTAGGVTSAYRVSLGSIALGGARVDTVRAAVVDRMRLGDVEGLLGNSSLSHFQVRVDSAAGRVVLSPR